MNGKTEIPPKTPVLKAENCATPEVLNFTAGSAQVTVARDPQVNGWPKSKTFKFPTSMLWKAEGGRVTLSIDQMIVTAVQTLATNGALLEYVIVDIIGKTWNPCDGWCPNLYIHLLDHNQGPLKVLDFGHLIGECGTDFHFVRQLSYPEVIFDLIEWCGRSGSSYNWKPC